MINRLMARGNIAVPHSQVVSLVRRVDWYRLVVVSEIAVLLILTVALTIAPQLTLSAAVALFADARDASLANRPLVAFFGLVAFGLTATLFHALLFPRARATASSTARRTQSES
jgi:hypothetical protein